MNPLSVIILGKLILLLNSVCSSVGIQECPPQDMIHPCTCRQESGGSTFLECKNIYNANDLKRIFVENPMMRFRVVNILFSSMLYLPHEMVDLSKFDELYIENTTLSSLFDYPPKENKIKNLEIINSIIQKFPSPDGWNNLQSFLIMGMPVKVVSSHRGVVFPKNLKEIALISTQTQFIAHDAFADVENLERIYISNNPLNRIMRSTFPRPFKATVINFDNNRINSLPLDILEDTPNLKILSLRNNSITILPEAVFQKTTGNQLTVMVDGNPIRCNCLLKWIVENKDVSIQGTCASPYKGRNLQDLKLEHFGHC